MPTKYKMPVFKDYPPYLAPATTTLVDPKYGLVTLTEDALPFVRFLSPVLDDGSQWMWLSWSLRYTGKKGPTGLLLFSPFGQYWQTLTFVSRNHLAFSSTWKGSGGTGRVFKASVTITNWPTVLGG